MTASLTGWFLAAAVLAAPQAVTFSETVAPIVYENCVSCHRPGEAAPFSLISYEDVKKRGPMIAAVTKSRYMPPWHAAHGYGEFKDERRLTDSQIAAIGDWVNQGMPQGDPSKMPALPQFTDGWQLGQPDLILEMPKGYAVPAAGPDIYRNFVLPFNLKEDKWVRAMEYRPGAHQAVHHVLFGFIGAGTATQLDGTDGQPGFFGGMAPVGLQARFGRSGGIGGWALGNTPRFLPEEHAALVPAGSDLILQTHFHPTGKIESERSVIGLYFADKAPERSFFGAELPALFGFGAGIDIPAGEKNYTIQDSLTLPVDLRVFGANAHAHYIGKEMKATAVLPDGTERPLLWIEDWNFNWQDTYTFKQPVTLPKGTRIDVLIRYDNSAENPRNPNNPPQRVRWGEQSADEMGSVSFLFEALRKQDEPALQTLFADRTRQAIQAGVKNGVLNRPPSQPRAIGVISPPRRVQITLADREGKVEATVGEPGGYSQPALAPDGSRIAVIKADAGTGNTDVWVLNVANGASSQITADAAPNSAPLWSPDGRHLAYVSQARVYRKAADGTGAEELLYQHTTNAQVVLSDWAADGRICFWAGDTMFVLDADHKTAKPLGEPGSRGGRFSPDGRHIAYSTNHSGRFEIMVVSADGSRVQLTKDGGFGGIFWREDGKELYYYSLAPQSVMAVDISSGPEVRAGTPRPLFRVPAAILGPAQLSSIASRDGRRFVFITPEAPR